jgi:hypothetical protein
MYLQLQVQKGWQAPPFFVGNVYPDGFPNQA